MLSRIYSKFLFRKTHLNKIVFLTVKKNKNKNDVKRLEIAHTIREFHHKSLWEEEKHFTWWISLVLSAQTIIYTSSTVRSQFKLVLISIGSLIGVFLCIIALKILRKEGEYFNTALTKFVEEYNTVYPKTPLPTAPKKANKSIWELTKLFFSGKIGIRDSFQFLFLFFIFVFIGILLFSFLTLKS